MEYTIFSKEGVSIRIIRKPDADGPPSLNENESYVIGNHKNKILVDGQITDKPESRITLTGTKLEKLPNPTEVTITGNGARFREIITDGEFYFSIDTPGKYIVKCKSSIELQKEFEVII